MAAKRVDSGLLGPNGRYVVTWSRIVRLGKGCLITTRFISLQLNHFCPLAMLLRKGIVPSKAWACVHHLTSEHPVLFWEEEEKPDCGHKVTFRCKEVVSEPQSLPFLVVFF